MNRPGHNQSYITTTNVDVYNCRRLPARLLIWQVAQLLGFQPYQLLWLIAAGHLECLGAPRPNSTKWFSSTHICALASDTQWLDTASKIVARAARKNSRSALSALSGLPTDYGMISLLPFKLLKIRRNETTGFKLC